MANHLGELHDLAQSRLTIWVVCLMQLPLDGANAWWQILSASKVSTDTRGIVSSPGGDRVQTEFISLMLKVHQVLNA